MSAVYLGSLILGLVLGVGSMLNGVERHKPGASKGFGVPLSTITSSDALLAATRQISARYAIPLFAAFAAGFGAMAYAMHRLTSLGVLWQLLIGAFAGGLAVVLAIALIAGWVVPSARRDVPDGRYVLQGQFARVTAPISDSAMGSVVFEVDGVQHALPARGLDDVAIDAGTEVVIERVESEIAYVEPWAQVERRL